MASEKEPDASDPKYMLLSLGNLARQDICVTVIDASDFDQTKLSVMTVREGEYSRRCRGKARGETVTEVDIPEQDDRTFADLMVDQIEFADVIIVNKVDLAHPEQVNHVKAVVKTLNQSAELLTSVNSAVPLSKVIGTGLFDIKKASDMESWQRDVADIKAGVEPKPETEEYGVGSFVFTALRPFHPKRLYKFIDEHFLMTVEYDEPEEEEEVCDLPNAISNGECDKSSEHNCTEGEESPDTVDSKPVAGPANLEDDDDGNADKEKNTDKGDQESVELINIENRRKQVEMKNLGKANFGGMLLRSKGTAYLASSRYFPIVWSHTGSFLTLSQEMPWFSESVSADSAENGTEEKKASASSSNGKVPHKVNISSDSSCGRAEDNYAMHGLDSSFILGDKCTELVLIGHQIDKVRLRKCLEECLLTDDEIARLGAPTSGQGGWCVLECPFEFPIYTSPPVVELGDEEDDYEKLVEVY